MDYEFMKCEKKFPNAGEGGSYRFMLSDDSNDYNRVRKALEEGVFIISGCRSKFEEDTVDGIKKQLDNFGVKYAPNEIEELKTERCNENSIIYKTLLDRYNSTTTKMLETDLRKMGYGFRPSAGGYKENINVESVDEMSFFVPYIKTKTPEQFLKDASELCRKYMQDSVFFKHPYYENGKAMWVNKNSNVDRFMKTHKPRFSGNEDYFTKTKKTNSKAFSLDPIWEEEFESEEGDIHTYDVEDLDKPLEKTFKDSGITIQQIIDKTCKYRMLPTSQRDALNKIYEKGWTRKG